MSADDTIGSLFLAIERRHERAAALQFRSGKDWKDMPDWRFLRQVIRVALYLRERAGVRPGERVALVSPVRAEAVVAQWATVVHGAVLATVDPALPDAALAAALAEHDPRVVFFADPALLERAGGAIRGAAVVVIDGDAPEPARAWSEVLDLGGTLDTAERANALRNECRALTPALLATPDATHGEIVARVRDLPTRAGDLGYVTAGGMHVPALRLALWAFVGDGVTRTALGTSGREAEEIAELKPQKIATQHGVRRLAR